MTHTNDDRYSVLRALAKERDLLGEDPEQIIALLRSQSASIMDCIKVMREVLGISLGEAKQLVHFSNAWADLRKSYEDTHGIASDVVRANFEVTEENGTYRFRVDLTSDDE
jgi:ribosomal protein L7/L12